jgi:ABC-type glycerol-3-phosphate transport system permease component
MKGFFKGSRRTRDLKLSNFLGRPLRILVIVAILAAVLFPLYWLISNSFKPEQEYYHSPPIMFPIKITGANFVDIVVNRGLFTGLRNSLAIALFTTLATVLFGSLASYALVNGMLPRRIKHIFAWWFLIQKMYPAIVVAVPVFYIIRSFQLMDRVAALVLMNTSFNLPLVILLMIGFYQEAPFEVEEQSMLDGCNLLQRYFFITSPMVRSGLIATGMLTFVASWNEFLYAVILTIVRAKPLTVLIAGFITDKALVWGPMAAMGCVIIAPVLVIMWAMQRDFISGVSAGALKG